jgi:hypothetical protein
MSVCTEKTPIRGPDPVPIDTSKKVLALKLSTARLKYPIGVY